MLKTSALNPDGSIWVAERDRPDVKQSTNRIIKISSSGQILKSVGLEWLTGAPIVTISFGEKRTFRLRPWPSNRERVVRDFEAGNGVVFVIPFETNLAWTHEVPS